MRKSVPFLLSALCLLLCACNPLSVAVQTPPPTQTAQPPATPAPMYSPQPTATPDDEDTQWMNEYIADQIAAAEACRIQTGEAEYYLDTSIPIELYGSYELEFPLYRMDNETGETEYLGTTGFTFQFFRDFIYIKSDTLQEDYPVGEMTRVVNLETGTITAYGRNMEMFLPEDGEYVYFTYDAVSIIYRANPSLERVKEIKIEIPEQDEIEANYGDIDELCTDITITNVEDGWIYFNYDVFFYEGGGIYEGKYRIRTDGSGLEKTDEGKLYE